MTANGYHGAHRRDEGAHREAEITQDADALLAAELPPRTAGRTERSPERRSRRGLLLGGVGGLALLGAGGAVLATQTGPGRSVVSGLTGGGSDGGGGGLFASPSPTPPPEPVATETARALVAALPDQSSQVPELAMTDLAPSGVQVVFPRIPSSHALSEALDICAGKLLRERLFRGTAATLAVTSRIIASSADTLGVLLDASEEEGPAASVVWFRADGDRPLASPALIAPESWAAFGAAVLAAAAKVRGTDPAELELLLQEQPRPFGNGPALLPAADGSLAVLFPSASAQDGRGELALTIDAATAAPLLSADGTAVQQAVAAPAPFDPARVTVPGDTHDGDSVYLLPAEIDVAAPAREADGPGPRTQLAPRSGHGVRPGIMVAPDATRLRLVSLTFDDGPSAELNATLRGHLEQGRAASTFFLIGQSVAEWPGDVARTSADGHELACHSWTHPQLSKAGDDRLEKEIGRPIEAIIEASGRVPYMMRPPYGARNNHVDDVVGSHDQSVQLWDLDTLDWQSRNVEKIHGVVQRETQRGSLMLMHEIHPSSVDAVPGILEWLAENGYTTVTNAELGQNQMRRGMHYTRGLVHGDLPDTMPEPGGGGASDGGGEAPASGTPSPSPSATG